ncbi:Lanthionine biosynthesis cyclase LanC [Actinosynnema pretiosum subsp. pretiosum]|nr:Lanthionine biosynthesis cyclase LanC [Actinosynnema pretiosum subsp. pretiosum]
MTTLTNTSLPTAQPGWGQDLSRGAAGIALLHLENGRWGTAQPWLRTMTEHPITAEPAAWGLYRGAPAVAFTLHAARRAVGKPVFQTALNTLDEHITTLTQQRLAAAHDRIDRRWLAEVREFDLISGLTGIGAYLLHAHGNTELLRQVLTYLVRLTEPVVVDGEQLPGWWSGNGPAGRPGDCCSGGHGNLGIAHGITGPLALLATTARRGTAVHGQHEAMERIFTWLDELRQGPVGIPWWPGIVSRAEHRNRTVRQHGPQRPSWCYGTPGLARAQQLAALALEDQARRRTAEQALIGCVNDEHQPAQLHDASLCHGWAGLLHTTRCTAADATDDRLAACLPALRTRLHDHLDRHGSPTSPGLLEGTTGVLLADRVGTASVTRWDACLLLNG